MAGELEGRIAVVTGASRGIGAGIAERLASEGAAIAVTARTLDSHPHLPGTLLETVATIEQRGGRAVAIQADLSDAADRARLVEEVHSRLGAPDILINNAAACFFLPFEKSSPKRFNVGFEINVRAPFELAQAFLPHMRNQRRGAIVNIGSSTYKLSEMPFSEHDRSGGSLIYGMTKAALNRFTTGLAAEAQADGVAVNLVMPVAAVVTPGVEAIGIDYSGVVVEPVEAMAEATLALCVADPEKLAGRIAESTPLLEELGRTVMKLDGSGPYAA